MTRIKMISTKMSVPSRFLLLLLGIFTVLTLSVNPASAATEKVLHSFEPYLNGQTPNTMVGDAQGNLYVVTNSGGRYESGLVLRFTPNSEWLRDGL